MAASHSPIHPILLLKTPSPSPSTDAYTVALSPPSSPIHFQPHYIPVLTHTLLPDPLIQLLLTHLSPSSPASARPFPYGALILTSQRAVAALRTALSSPPIQNLPREKLQELKVRLYAVGPATAKGTEDVAARWLPQCKVYGGTKAGSGEVLAQLMLGDGLNEEERYDDNDDSDENSHHSGVDANETDERQARTKEEGEEQQQYSNLQTQTLPNQQRRRRKPVLFLVGEKRRDIIPKMLRDPPASTSTSTSTDVSIGKTPDPSPLKSQPPNLEPKPIPIPIDEMLVYQSAELDEFAFTFQQTLHRTDPDLEHDNNNNNENNYTSTRTSERTRWIVIFSPTAVNHVLEALNILPTGPNCTPTPTQSRIKRSTYIACIGPTTQSYLREKFGVEADIVAERPSPEGLREGIVDFMRAREWERGSGDMG